MASIGIGVQGADSSRAETGPMKTNTRWSKALPTLLLFSLLTGSPWAEPPTPLHDAADAGDLKQVKALISAHPEWVDLEDEEGETPLMEAAEEGRLEVVQFLLSKGADINHQDQDGETALMEAAQENKADCVTLLLSKGAALGCLDGDARTVLQRPTSETIQQLLRARGAR